MTTRQKFINERNADYAQAIDKAVKIADYLRICHNLEVADDWCIGTDRIGQHIKDMSVDSLECVYRELEMLMDKLEEYKDAVDNIIDARQDVDTALTDWVDSESYRMNGDWYKVSDTRHEWRDDETDELRAYLEYDADDNSWLWINAEHDHGTEGYSVDELDEAKADAMADWEKWHRYGAE